MSPSLYNPALPEPIVGIDLGTTNSLVAVAGWPGAGEAARVLVEAGGRGLLPSAVRFEDGGGVVVGDDAKERAVEFPLATVVSVKRLMGRSLKDATGDLKFLSYEVVEGPNETVRVRIGEREVSPQEVSAIILRELRERASRVLGVPVRKAVITVPAYFDDAQRQATRDAARLAGLEAVRLVAEPTAAALAYGLGLRSGAKRRAQVVAVYDLGGGTFDVSVLRITPSAGGDEGEGMEAFQVLSTSGDTHLGGDDFDYALMGLFTREIGERFFGGRDVGAELSPGVRRALRDFAERTKIRLSEADEARVEIDLGDGEGGAGAGGARVYSRVVTRVEFEGLIEGLIERTMVACKRAVRDAKRLMEGEELSAVVMVGGSTRVPRVRERVREVFGVEPYVALDPDVVVALGAAVQGSVLSGARRDALLLDVVPLSLGIETAGGAFAKIVMRGATIPAMASEMFSTQVDGQTAIKLQVLQGEREMAADCRSLGTYHLRGIPAMPAGIPQLRVEFRVDANGVLSVLAMERRSGKRLDVQIVPSHGLTRAEVERLELESFAHAREDMRRHRIADLVANSGLDLHWIGKQMTQHGAKLAPGTRAAIESAINELRDLVERAKDPARSDGVDPDVFYRAKEALDRASVGLHEVSISESLKEE